MSGAAAWSGVGASLVDHFAVVVAGVDAHDGVAVDDVDAAVALPDRLGDLGGGHGTPDVEELTADPGVQPAQLGGHGVDGGAAAGDVAGRGARRGRGPVPGSRIPTAQAAAAAYFGRRALLTEGAPDQGYEISGQVDDDYGGRCVLWNRGRGFDPATWPLVSALSRSAQAT
jgi:hypothetical protein